jgi:hypothetical protein
MPKSYTVKTRFTFTGTFFVKADTKAMAREYVEKHCGMVMGRGIHTSLPKEDADWNFPVHPDKGIVSVKRTETEAHHDGSRF